ncbi:MAG: hypothetical protein VXY23_15675 [Pseudomonadota bacterium]|nr:hypothetical protein [Pseudomonadota bacterium]|tara:strand:+ start:3211 stop:3552 length:342 start_codon:yes stop_codon:yes gene_type:complete
MKARTVKRWILWMVLIDFSVFSAWVMWEVGYFGIWAAGMASPGAWQVLIDLVIAGGLICWWMVVDARKRGVNPWPWVVSTFALGTLVPLAYLLWREYEPKHQEVFNSEHINPV